MVFFYFACVLIRNKFLIFTREALFYKNRALPSVLAHATDICFGCCTHVTREYFIPQLGTTCKVSCCSPWVKTLGSFLAWQGSVPQSLFPFGVVSGRMPRPCKDCCPCQGRHRPRRSGKFRGAKGLRWGWRPKPIQRGTPYQPVVPGTTYPYGKEAKKANDARLIWSFHWDLAVSSFLTTHLLQPAWKHEAFKIVFQKADILPLKYMPSIPDGLIWHKYGGCGVCNWYCFCIIRNRNHNPPKMLNNLKYSELN